MNRIVSLALFAFLFAAHSLQAEPIVTMISSGNNVQEMVLSSEHLFCATTGGVVEWDTRDMSYKKFTMVDGLPDNSIQTIVKSPDGKIWCTTGKGLAVFDGTSWLPFSGGSFLIKDIEFASDGTMYIPGQTGLRTLKDGKWTTLSSADGVPSGSIFKIARGNDGTMAFGSNGYGVGIVTGSWKKIFSLKDGLPDNNIISLAIADSHAVWVGTYYGAAMFDGTAWKIFTKNDGLLSNTINGIHIAPDGRVFLATDIGVSVYDGKAFTSIVSELNLEGIEVTAVLTGNDGIRWYGTENGIRKEQANVFSTFRTHDGPVNDYIMDSDLAPDGSIWFATSRGVSRQYQGKFTNYTVEDGLPARFVFCLETAANGDIWAGTYSDGVGRFDGEKWTKFSIEDGLVSKSITSIAIAPDGAVWCGSPSGWPSGLCYYKDGKWTQVQTDESLSSSSINRISIGPTGDVWVGTNNGAFRLSGGKWTSFTTKDGLPDNNVQRPLVLNDNTVVLVTLKGAGYFDGTKYTDFGVNAFQTALDIEGDTLENLKFGTGFGVFEKTTTNIWNMYTSNEYSAVGFGPVKKINILPNASITSITTDTNGDIWCGTANGVEVISFGPTGVESENGLPSHFAILGNFPNPFNPSTTIEYTLPATGTGSLAIYNVTGQKVRELVTGIIPAGKHSVLWDGRDQSGKAVSGGIYFCRMKCGAEIASGKMLLIK